MNRLKEGFVIGNEYEDNGKQLENGALLAQLEKEIHLLRNKMVSVAMENSCLTAQDVIDISMRLDEKINEYMDLTKKD